MHRARYVCAVARSSFQCVPRLQLSLEMALVHVPILIGAGLAIGIASSVLKVVASLQSVKTGSFQSTTGTSRTNTALLTAFRRILILAFTMASFLVVFATCTLLIVPKIHKISLWIWDFMLCGAAGHGTLNDFRLLSEGAESCDDIGTSIDDAPDRPSAAVMGLAYATQPMVPLLLSYFNFSMNKGRYSKQMGCNAKGKKSKSKRQTAPRSSSAAPSSASAVSCVSRLSMTSSTVSLFVAEPTTGRNSTETPSA